MLQWLSANLGTIIICVLLLAAVGAIVRHLLRQKKQGKSSCGCGCSTCAMNGSCHTKK